MPNLAFTFSGTLPHINCGPLTFVLSSTSPNAQPSQPLHQCFRRNPTRSSKAPLTHAVNAIQRRSWFRNCGSAGNTNFDHTWHEGIQACKIQSQTETVMGQQVKAAQQNSNDSSPNDDGMTNSKVIIITTADTLKIIVNVTLLLVIVF